LALATLGTADVVAVALGGTARTGWLLAAGWFVAAALCARRARRLARAGRGDGPGAVT